jgi:hypothetical protein
MMRHWLGVQVLACAATWIVACATGGSQDAGWLDDAGSMPGPSPAPADDASPAADAASRIDAPLPTSDAGSVAPAEAGNDAPDPGQPDGASPEGGDGSGDGGGYIGDASGDQAPGTPAAGNVVFVSSMAYQAANLGGLSGADAKCQALALQANLAGTFKAWLSDSQVSAATRLAHSALPYVLVDGTLVASDWSQLTSGSLAHPIDRTETGGPPPTGGVPGVLDAVWTNTKDDGTIYSITDCGDWSSPSQLSLFHFGSASKSTGAWTLDTTNTETGSWCAGFTAALYCIAQ